MAQATTDPLEVKALNRLFQQWNLAARPSWWNISGEPCSGVALDTTSIDKDNYGPSIRCDCSYDNDSTCHITELRIYMLNIVGSIPEELWSLSYLTYLNLGLNLLTGSISPQIGNLSSMQYLSLNANAFSGELPNEIGNLHELLAVSFAENNFSGSLPPSLGNLSKLQQLYFSSSGISGAIPSSYANLTDLNTLWASDGNLTGSVPVFIGNWLKLTVLRLQGNSFAGPIPSTFSKLTSLKELRVSDISSGISTLEFLADMRNLTTLVLRNNNIHGEIPLYISNNENLEHLDLSFNNLIGSIPASIFALDSLSYLFLGSNNLTGALPSKKGTSLVYIDLSYNNLSGSFPSWVNENIQSNFVANHLTAGSSNSGDLPSGWICLQRPFPCRDPGVNIGFAINCGGPPVKSSNGTLFEGDYNNGIGPASFFVSETKRWALSNVGIFTDGTNYEFTHSTSKTILNTPDRALFQTTRTSASSLRYYGLGLQNGNYTVNLGFVETAFPDDSQWTSRGRRLFDIYIQGILMSKDFNIRKEAGGRSFRAVEKAFKVQVFENYVEIHLFWAGKGTCCMPDEGTYGPSISAIRVSPDFTPTFPDKRKNMMPLIAGIAVSVGVMLFLSTFVTIYFLRIRKRRSSNQQTDALRIATGALTFNYSELHNATNGFSLANKLGQGGFGIVYKGILGDGRLVAVKKLSAKSDQGNNQFLAEIATISAVQHRNLVNLYGCCVHGDKRLIVYEFLENSSLDHALFEKTSLLIDWGTRYDICLGIARGLAYLHEESRVRIVHRDVKASNILLDSSLNPKISDFGLAKLYDDKMTHINTTIAGTIGYLAPEYAMRGHLTEKTDVFAFGVVALEIVGGKPNCASEEEASLLDWAWHLYENEHHVELVDPRLSEFEEEEVKRVIHVALLCTQMQPSLRPPMSSVLAMLLGRTNVIPVPSKPGYLTDNMFGSFVNMMSGTSMEGNLCSDDLSSHMSLANTGEESPKSAVKPILKYPP
ncbi:probable LRR receptor-like serine/threonine-protein kinase At1g56140 [Eucalyptus grandis]|uniref:probable LRR receptor-like serine/threonine-protein kinase At1g56140 n=1 Tax=Eucalyptus grandis TaxID=71139 RepID=UPI00192E8F33|nr:probable LRR receptor-like serine/threonine-protein kinase At1g56140 [Eucalyptus grandis]